MKAHRNKKILISLSAALVCAFATPVFAATAVFAGGCFWCMEKDFEALQGVTGAVSGFTGGTASDPTYGGDHAGHYEAVEVSYDPALISYEQLLQHFWVNIDPFDGKGQFCDKGPSYLSAVFVHDDIERKLAEQSREAVVARFPGQEVVTPILPLTTFFPIKGNEIHHQDFYKKSPVRYKGYRYACGRDKRLKQIWKDDATV